MNMAALKNLRMVRLLAILFLVAVFVGCSAVIALYFFATPDKIRSALIPVIEEQLECDVEFAGIDFNLFSGVRLTGLDVASEDGEQPWLQVDEAVLRYRFLPLLKGRLVIDELRLNAPSVVVKRHADGSFSVGKIVRKPKEISPAGAPGEVQEHSLVDFHVSTVVVSNAEILVRDFVFGEIPRLTRFQEVGLKLDNFSADSVSSFAMWGKLNGTPLDLEGDYDPNTHSGTLNLVLEGLDMVAFQPYYREYLPFKINRLGISSQSNIQFSPKGVELKGDIRLADADISGLDKFISGVDTFTVQQLSSNLHLEWSKGSSQLNLRRADTRLDGLQLGAQGTVYWGAGRHEYAMDLELRSWPIRALASYAALPWLDKLDTYAPAGTCSAAFAWRKDAKDTHGSLRTGKVVLTDAGLSAGGVRFGINGEIALDGNKLNAVNLIAKIGGENFNASLFSRNWRAGRPKFNLSLKGTSFDAFNLFASTRGRADVRSGVQTTENNFARVASEPGPYNIPFDADVTFAVDTVSWRNILLKQVRGEFSVLNNELTLKSMEAGFASGKLNSRASVDLGQQGLNYRINLEADQLNMKQVLAALWPGFGGTVSGNGNLSATITGAGTQQLRLRQNLSGNVSISVENGTLGGVNALYVLARRINLPSLAKPDFAAASAEFYFETGAQPRFNLLGRNEQMRIAAQGRLGWQGSITGDLSLHLPPSPGADINPEFIRGATRDANGWDVVKCDVAGMLSQPEFEPVVEYMPGSVEPD